MIDRDPLAHARAADPRPSRTFRRPYPRAELLLALLVATPSMACIVVPGDDEPAASTKDTASPDPSSESGDTPPADTDDPTGGEVPAECFEPAVADARFSLELDGWPVAEDSSYEIAVACTVLDVQTEGTDLVTTLECDDAGQLRPATVRIAATDEGTPSWGPASEVALTYFIADEWDLSDIYRILTLRRADDQALLVAATDSDGLPSDEFGGTRAVEALAPVVPTEDREYCGWYPDSQDTLPMRVILELEGESLAVVNGQRGVLPIPGETDRLAVDIGKAIVGDDGHWDSWVHLLVRRVS